MVYFCHARIPDYVIKPAAVEAARPFKDEKKSVACSCTESERCEEEERSEEEDNVVENHGALRVTTRANVPYNLEGYTKNAMLMMSRAPQHHRTYYDADIREKMIRVTQVFENFRFEIIQHENLTSGQVDQTCQDFFRRDFADYGCVAVVLFTAHDCKFEYNVLGRHWETNGNPTLRGKPKLYINEARHQQADWLCRHPDVLYMHIPSNPSMSCSHVNVTQPLFIMCNKLTTMANDHLWAITEATLMCSDYVPNLKSRMFFASTLTKKVFLPRRN